MLLVMKDWGVMRFGSHGLVLHGSVAEAKLVGHELLLTAKSCVPPLPSDVAHYSVHALPGAGVKMRSAAVAAQPVAWAVHVTAPLTMSCRDRYWPSGQDLHGVPNLPVGHGLVQS